MPEQVLMSPAGTNSLKSQLARRQSSAFAFCPAPACFARPQANRLILRRQALPSFSRYGYAAYPTYRSGGTRGPLMTCRCRYLTYCFAALLYFDLYPEAAAAVSSGIHLWRTLVYDIPTHKQYRKFIGSCMTVDLDTIQGPGAGSLG